jgi:hypothetical protein
LKYFLFLSLIILATACGENVQSYNKLTESEREYIREEAARKCKSDTADATEDFIKNSNQELVRFQRGDHWKITVPGLTNPDFIYVWNVVGSTVYFMHQQQSGGATTHKFIKMTAAFNGQMIEDLRVQKCLSKVPAISINSSSITIKYLDNLTTEGTTKYKSDKTYTASSGQPAFFSTFALKIFKEKLNDDDDVVSSENITASIAYENDDGSLFNTYAQYSPRQYCVFKYGATTPKTFTYPYELNCVPGETDNANPNPTADPTMDFKASDLGNF